MTEALNSRYTDAVNENKRFFVTDGCAGYRGGAKNLYVPAVWAVLF